MDNNKVKIDWRGSSKSIRLNKRGVSQGQKQMDRVKKRLSQDEFSFLGGRPAASERTNHQWQGNQHQLRSIIFIRVIVEYLIIKVQFGVKSNGAGTGQASGSRLITTGGNTFIISP